MSMSPVLAGPQSSLSNGVTGRNMPDLRFTDDCGGCLEWIVCVTTIEDDGISSEEEREAELYQRRRRSCRAILGRRGVVRMRGSLCARVDRSAKASRAGSVAAPARRDLAAYDLRRDQRDQLRALGFGWHDSMRVSDQSSCTTTRPGRVSCGSTDETAVPGDLPPRVLVRRRC